MDYSRLRSIQLQSRKLRDQLVASPYAWPGGYPMFAITTDGGCLCHKCCASEHKSIGFTYGSDGWAIAALDVNYEDPSLYCDHCNNRIDSVYAEDVVTV
jgi:hypothetical protein